MYCRAFSPKHDLFQLTFHRIWEMLAVTGKGIEMMHCHSNALDSGAPAPAWLSLQRVDIAPSPASAALWAAA
jgi:hypothetical protein